MHIKIIQKIIDKIRRKQPKNSHIELLGKKIISYERIQDKIDTLILGSSHAQLGYRAKENEFNLGTSFQDLYFSYSLYKKYNNPNLKKIILFYSVFSPGSQTIKSKFAYNCAAQKAVTGINYQDINAAKDKFLYKLDYDYKNQFKKFKKRYIFDSKYRGNEVSYKTCFKPPTAIERAMPHYKNNKRQNNQTDYVIKMQKLANQNNVNMLVVISPATKAYKESLPESEVLFKDLFEVSQKYKINVLNMYDTEMFDNSDFEDWDHLNINGAQKLTKEINTYMDHNILNRSDQK